MNWCGLWRVGWIISATSVQERWLCCFRRLTWRAKLGRLTLIKVTPQLLPALAASFLPNLVFRHCSWPHRHNLTYPQSWRR